MDVIQRKAFKRHVAIGVLIAVFFIIYFTVRLIPSPTADRAIFISVAEYLLSKHRLYIDIYDNKDPLFFYAVSMQRLFGLVGEYLFELGMVIIAAVSAYDISKVIDNTGTKRRTLLLFAVPVLVTGCFWVPGYTHLPATAFSLLACSLFLRKKMLYAGGCIGLVAFTKLIMFPLPAAFCFTYEVILWNKNNSQKHLSRIIIGFTSASIMMLIVLLIRDELFGYVQAQQNNFLYASSGFVDNSSFINAFASHLRLMFLISARKIILLLSLIISISFAGYMANQPRVNNQIRAFLISTLATYFISIIILGITGIWSHHLQLIYFPQTLALIYIAINLKLKKLFSNLIYGITIIVLAMLLSGTFDVGFPVQIMKKISLLTQESPENQALKVIYPNGTEFARLGQNSNVIPHGSAKDKLLCPDFAQYFFYSPQRLKHILNCAKTAPTLVVADTFSRLEEAPYSKLKLSEAQKQIMMENWNNFITSGENMITTQYSCKKIKTTRICDSITK